MPKLTTEVLEILLNCQSKMSNVSKALNKIDLQLDLNFQIFRALSFYSWTE